MLYGERTGIGLRNVEILLADVFKDRADMSDRGVYVLFHDGPVYAASVAERHLDKALVDIAVLNVIQSIHAAFRAVCGYELIPVVRQIHAAQNSAGDGEAARPAWKAFAEFGLYLNVLGNAHLVEFLKSENGVHTGANGLLFF